jgi:hypothetical protein
VTPVPAVPPSWPLSAPLSAEHARSGPGLPPGPQRRAQARSAPVRLVTAFKISHDGSETRGAPAVMPRAGPEVALSGPGAPARSPWPDTDP